MKEGEYSHLQINELSQQWLEKIAEKCRQKRINTQKKKRLFALGVVLAGTILLITVIFLLNMMLE